MPRPRSTPVTSASIASGIGPAPATVARSTWSAAPSFSTARSAPPSFSRAAFGRGSDADGNETVIDSHVKISFWDALPTTRNERATFRCQVDGGAWRGIRISGPTPENDDQRVLNRVAGRNGEVREGEGESICYQQHRFTFSAPFWVRGADKQLSAPPADADGAWRCQLRRGSGRERHVVREFHFTVEGNEVQPVNELLPMAPGSALIGVAFDPAHLPVAFDPAEVRRGFMGVAWPSPDASPVVGMLPRRASRPRFTRPGGVR